MPRLYAVLLALLGLLGTVRVATAQNLAVLSGQVRDSLTREPLPSATVFLAHTTLGAATDVSGNFAVKNIRPGTYEVVVSYLGYRLSRRVLTVAAGPSTLNVLLSPTPNTLTNVVIRPRNNPADYRSFVRLLLGSTSFSRQCQIRNPDDVVVLRDRQTNELTARSDKGLQVDNRALGYRITYHGLRFKMQYASGIVSFYGLPAFEELTPRDAKEQQRWQDNRRRAYLGSLPHFLRSVYQGRVSEEGFLVQQLRSQTPDNSVVASTTAEMGPPAQHRLLYPTPLPIDSLRQADADRVRLRFPHLIQVTYQREQPDAAYSDYYLAQKGLSAPRTNVPRRGPDGQLMPPAAPDVEVPTSQISVLRIVQPRHQIYANGTLDDPLAVLAEGYWAFEKLGEFLPINYEAPAAQ